MKTARLKRVGVGLRNPVVIRLWRDSFRMHVGNKGFTLVELLIAMTIIALILGLSASGYYGLRTTTILKQSAESLKSDIMYAKRSAMLVKREQGENWINGIGLDLANISQDPPQYRLFKYCADDADYHDFANEYIISVVGQGSLPSDYYSDCKSLGESEFTTIIGYERVNVASSNVKVRVAKDDDPLLNSVRFIFFESPTGQMHFYDCYGNEIVMTPSHSPVRIVFSLGSRAYQVKIDSTGEIVTNIYDGGQDVELVEVCNNEIDVFGEPE